MGGIGQDRIVHAQQPRVALEPCLVAEVAVGASPDDDRFLGLEVGLQLPERYEFGGADECEISWIEEQHNPLTAMLGQRHTFGPMGASYPIIHSGFRCRRPDPNAHQCLLVVGWHRATARTIAQRHSVSSRCIMAVGVAGSSDSVAPSGSQ